jgi:hypothetical protein
MPNRWQAYPPCPAEQSLFYASKGIDRGRVILIGMG